MINHLVTADTRHIKGLFGSVVAVAFQIVFRAKMHVNDVFLMFLTILVYKIFFFTYDIEKKTPRQMQKI